MLLVTVVEREANTQFHEIIGKLEFDKSVKEIEFPAHTLYELKVKFT